MLGRVLNRRDALRAMFGAGAALAADRHPLGALVRRSPDDLIQRPIPSSGELLPVIGIGTARRFDIEEGAEERPELREVLRRFPTLGGRVVDTAPSYGRAEIVVGELVSEVGVRDRLFLATKVAGRSRDASIAQMEESLRRLRTERIDLMQIHNLTNVEENLPLLREWKDAGRIRYLGVTTSFERQYEPLESLMRAEPLDFVQLNYSIDNREAERTLLPLAADRGMAVLVNLPFGRTRVFEKVEGRPLPGWAAEIGAESWAQVFLKYIVSHPAVTAAIPGTARVRYLLDNMAAARGELPDAATRRTIETFFDSL